MTGDDQNRNEPFLPGHSPDEAAGDEISEATDPSSRRQWWEDMPDPWDRPQFTHGPTDETEELDAVTDRPVRSAGRRFGWRRATTMVALTATVLIGTGVLASALRPESSALPAPPSPPQRQDASPPAEGRSGVGDAPSPALTPNPTPLPSLTASAPPAPPAATPSATSAPPLPTPPKPDAVSFEAEAAELGGLASVYDADAASGGQAVGNLGGWGLHYVQFPAVAAGAGEYQLTFHYLADRDRRGQFSINDGPRTIVDFPALDDGAVGTVTVTVELAEGENTVWFSSSNLRGPDLDRITVIE